MLISSKREDFDMATPAISKKSFSALIKAFRKLGPANISALSRESGLSRPTIYKAIPELLESGTISLVKGPEWNHRGRLPAFYRLNTGQIGAACFNGHFLIVALDLGQGRVHTKHMITADAGPMPLLHLVKKALADLAAEANTSLGLSAFTLGLPSAIDNDGLIQRSRSLLGWRQMKPLEFIKNTLSIESVGIDHLGNLGANGASSVTRSSNLLYLYTSRSLFLGAVADGSLYRGSNGIAGQIGHLLPDAVSNDATNCKPFATSMDAME